MPDERQRRSLDAVNQLVGEFNRERDREDGKYRPSTSSETHASHATANPGRLSLYKSDLAVTARIQRRFSARQTTRKPDQSSSMAATLMSTSPIGSACSRTTLSVMSLRWPPARRGQATQIAPAG